MSNLNTQAGARFGLERAAISASMPVSTPFMFRLGRREASVSRDFRKRYYSVNPVIDCNPGVQRGHLEVLLFRKWLVVLSKAH